jgi:hypothetical protein
MEDLNISVEFGEGYEPSPSVRAALESLAQAVLAAETSDVDEVTGFAAGLDIGGTPRMPIGPGPFVPTGGHTDSWRICFGGYQGPPPGYGGGGEQCGFYILV